MFNFPHKLKTFLFTSVVTGETVVTFKWQGHEVYKCKKEEFCAMELKHHYAKWKMMRNHQFEHRRNLIRLGLK